MWAQARAPNYSARPRSGRPLFGEALARKGQCEPWRRSRCRRGVGFDARFHAIAQVRAVGFTAPDRGALAYAACGVRRTASRCCVSSEAAAALCLQECARPSRELAPRGLMIGSRCAPRTRSDAATRRDRRWRSSAASLRSRAGGALQPLAKRACGRRPRRDHRWCSEAATSPRLAQIGLCEPPQLRVPLTPRADRPHLPLRRRHHHRPTTPDGPLKQEKGP